MTTATSLPIVSIVMPVWNGVRYLSLAIESVLSQTFRDFELIIVDDGSEDNTGDIVTQFAVADERIRPLFASHRGVVESLNLGCSVAQGKYIARLDYDDIALPERLERQVAFLEGRPKVALLGTAFQFITASGQRTRTVIYPPLDDATIRQQLRKANCFCHSAVMMRADAFANVGGYRKLCTEAQDYDLWSRMADLYELASISEIAVLYRVHPRQVSSTHIEHQALVSVAVRTSSEIRRKTGSDPLEKLQAIDRSTLVDLGLSDEEIDAELVIRYLNCIAWMPELGLGKQALDALRTAATDLSSIRALDNQIEPATFSLVHYG
jgi:glycosyltransferase involved in cell wall biosynthesis